MLDNWPLTGRAEELSAVVSYTRGRGVVLAGAAGVGKSRLAHEALAHARRTAREWRYVTATASARSVPLGAFAEYATHLGEDPLARIGEVVDAVTCSSSGPPLVMIDDAHLLDEQSAIVAHQLVHRGAASVVLTIRAGESAPDAITALWKEQLLPRLELQPLSRTETAELIERVLGGPIESASAARLWHYTRGNVLYLRQLMSDEVTVGHLMQRCGVWFWDSEPAVSPTLAELIDTNIGRQPDRVIEVLDVLAVAAPVDLGVLRAIVVDDAIEDAEAANLIVVDTKTTPRPTVRLAHPMYGEARRSRAPAMRLRRVRSAIVAASAPLTDGPVDEVRLVRRAVLAIDSDSPPDPTMLIAAADAAIRLMDPLSAQRIAERAVTSGGGLFAQLMLMSALVNGERLKEALEINGELLKEVTPSDRVSLGLIRIGIYIRQNDRVAARGVDELETAAAEAGMTRSYQCVVAAVRSLDNDIEAAVDAAIAGLTGPGELTEAAEFAGIFGLITASGERGSISMIREFADRGYALACTSTHTASSRFALSACHVVTLLLAGMLADADDVVANRVDPQPMEFPLALAYRAFTHGLVATATGELAAAHRLLGEAGVLIEQQLLRSCISFELATSLAMAGDAERARAEVDTVATDDPVRQSLVYADTAEAWIRAADDLVSDAVTIVLAAAERARRIGASAREVCFLQLAAQFGDASHSERLVELVAVVEGPRAHAAAAHAHALGSADGDGLFAAARDYEAFGDRVAAGDAAAQAAIAYRAHARRGAALTATAFARRLADETGADTPALRANDTPIPLTGRQREIIGLARHGLSNREIAQRLTMSVRTVEGHMFRACQRTGVNSRDELVALLSGR
ncbi:helix-turn-helix transcriptional regulator [Gordonia sp. TBRC 11910]|uniref:Helix-turn-helix transcriptional regulator n=1 Tax=Gordonia asplenii TaxID=2725283 RepID=A0A848L2N1_9ACTN|nr:LuxR family transcriptional regulator [Gordonia asplenii]NMO05026.1 helix-turn-helix transcriptional regulator [Gordonia asplenii]